MRSMLENLVLTPDEMAAVDRAASASGLSSQGLMERAGRAVAAAALRRFPGGLRFAVLCGPGNNGGDGYVAARALVEAGAPVALFAFGDPDALTGDAAAARHLWAGDTISLAGYQASPGDVVIDALFGAGLARDLPDTVCRVIDAVNGLALPVVAADLPSGVDGRTGAVRGAAFDAAVTVTFMCRKPGHLLMPGRALCGETDVFDIGIPPRIVLHEGHHLRVNGPDIWRMALPKADGAGHKYGRGHLAVFSGGAGATGAARLAAGAGLRAGAGLVTVLGPGDALAALEAHLTAVMLRRVDDERALAALLADDRFRTFVLGPAFGDLAKARAFVAATGRRALVLDADGITAFRDDPDALFALFRDGPPRLVMTPHDGEFARLFADLAADGTLSKVDRARAAAARSNAVIVLKGADTVIAAPDGRALINDNAPPCLATAGSGDVLAGIVGAHLAQRMPPFEAAAAAVWRHGEAGRKAGDGLTAETLVEAIGPLVQP
ncbi:NAD(P)H-hydrate dehydratase [Rhizobium sp. TRM95111]|uniref:NAD(P)H-hydrate dehydratase n=1 Tax=Rhizobium alarense TaxID=2846851 RepID=UPI001F3E65CB|nr:NAD(P)H-hydrate dehydratase [Rhizobium alarense]MCF3641104.1 NAD(P)H-hydrate dehydratase [Rhizobium alarense]